PVEAARLTGRREGGRPPARMTRAAPPPEDDPMEQPIILCGLGRVGRGVLEYLRAAGLPVVVVDTRCAPGDRGLAGVRVVPGDCRRREVLEEAGVAHAAGVLIMTGDDLANISTALM